jgi:mRNA interferase RelE/StbE
MKLMLSPAAARALRGLPGKEAAALLRRLEAVAADPFGDHPWASRLQGGDRFRVRQGDWRAVYRIDRDRQTVLVELVAHRREVYR